MFICLNILSIIYTTIQMFGDGKKYFMLPKAAFIW